MDGGEEEETLQRDVEDGKDQEDGWQWGYNKVK